MSTVFDILRRFQDFNARRIAMQAMAKTGDKMLDLNRDQLYHGLKSDGHRMQRYRSKQYAQQKNEMNPLPGLGNPDLFLTGRTYESMEIDFNGEQIEYLMNDPYGLREKYGDEIQGLHEKNKSFHARENLMPVFVNLAKEKLRL